MEIFYKNKEMSQFSDEEWDDEAVYGLPRSFRSSQWQYNKGSSQWRERGEPLLVTANEVKLSIMDCHGAIAPRND